MLKDFIINYCLFVSIFATYQIASLPGELLGGLKKQIYLASQKSHWVTQMALKLVTCAYCLSFWTSLLIEGSLLLSCACFITIFFTEKLIR